MMSIEKQLELLHQDGYRDSEDTLRLYLGTNGCKEFTQLLAFAKSHNLSELQCQDKLRCLWTAYCIHCDMECDTRAYDNDLLGLWYVVEAREPVTMSWHDFDSFDTFAGKYLC